MFKIIAPNDDAFTTACAILDEAKLRYSYSQALGVIVMNPSDDGAHKKSLELIEAMGCRILVL